MGKRRKRSVKSKLKALNTRFENQLIEPLVAQHQANTIVSLCAPGEHKDWLRWQLATMN